MTPRCRSVGSPDVHSITITGCAVLRIIAREQTTQADELIALNPRALAKFRDERDGRRPGVKSRDDRLRV